MSNPAVVTRLTLIDARTDRSPATFARDVVAGLQSSPKRLPCRYFYDALGSALFEAICRLPEYYLTRAEEGILRTHREEIAELFPGAIDLIELGSGSAIKTRLLIEAFLEARPHLRYVPIDISAGMLEETARQLVHDYPALSVTAIAGEYREGLDRLRSLSPSPRLVLWLGSNIGNFERDQAADFLADLRRAFSPGDGLLVGIDLRKDRAVLEAAYDDPTGVTAAFNRNILGRINRELGGHFDLHSFSHRATYDEVQGRVAMYLVSKRAQCVGINDLKLEVSLGRGEVIQTEHCYKYSLDEIDSLAEAAGLIRAQTWFDSAHRFGLNLFRVRTELR